MVGRCLGPPWVCSFAFTTVPAASTKAFQGLADRSPRSLPCFLHGFETAVVLLVLFRNCWMAPSKVSKPSLQLPLALHRAVDTFQGPGVPPWPTHAPLRHCFLYSFETAGWHLQTCQNPPCSLHWHRTALYVFSLLPRSSHTACGTAWAPRTAFCTVSRLLHATLKRVKTLTGSLQLPLALHRIAWFQQLLPCSSHTAFGTAWISHTAFWQWTSSKVSKTLVPVVEFFFGFLCFLHFVLESW